MRMLSVIAPAGTTCISKINACDTMVWKEGRLSYRLHCQNIPRSASLITAFSTTPGPSHTVFCLDYCDGLPTGLSAFPLVPQFLVYSQRSHRRNALGSVNVSILYSEVSTSPLPFDIEAGVFCWPRGPASSGPASSGPASSGPSHSLSGSHSAFPPALLPGHAGLTVS